MEDKLVKAARVALRITTQDTDLAQEVKDLVAAARADLQVAGVINLDVTPEPPTEPPAEAEILPLYKRAVLLYCKAHFGQNPDADKLLARYEDTKARMSLDPIYRGIESGV